MVAPRAIMPCSMAFSVPAAMASTPSKGSSRKSTLRAVDDGGGERELLLHAVREVGDELLCFVGEAHELEQFGGALLRWSLRRGRTCGRRSGGTRLAVRRPNSAMPSGTTPIWRLTSTELAARSSPRMLDGAAGGREQAGEHLDGGGFAGAVGAEEAEELAGLDGEVDVVDGGEVAETAGEARGGDGRDHVAEAYLRGNCQGEKIGSSRQSKAGESV